MNIIYLVYRAERETEQENLDKFINVMNLAGFDSSLIKCVTYEQYLDILNIEIPSFAIAINDTYKDLSGIYADKLKVSVFDFFSKEYVDVDNQVFLTGIVINSKDIFNPIYKKYVWNNFKKSQNKRLLLHEFLLCQIILFVCLVVLLIKKNRYILK